MESLIEDITTRGLAFIDANKSPMNAFRAPEWRETPESWIANYVHHGGSMTTPAYSSSKHQRLGDFLRSLPSYTALLASIDESSDCFWRIEKMFKQVRLSMIHIEPLSLLNLTYSTPNPFAGQESLGIPNLYVCGKWICKRM